MRSLRNQATTRLLVVRLGAMGDILHALPAVTRLRLEHPDWRIDWAVEPRWRALLAAAGAESSTELSAEKPLMNRVHFAPTKAWGKRPLSPATLGEIVRLRSALRAEKYDVVLDLQGSIKSAVIAKLAGARRVIGLASPREGVARWFYSEHVSVESEHVIEQGLELAGRVAEEALPHALPLLPVDSQAERWCEELLVGEERPVVLVNAGAGWGAKCWPLERYSEVVRELVREGCCVLLNAGPGEEAMAKAIADATGMDSMSTAARVVICSIAQLIALTRKISLLIAGDTGPLHLACALGKPVVGIYGPTEPGRNGPYGERYRVLRSPISRRDHRRLQETEAGLLKISSKEVFDAAKELLFDVEKEA